MFDEPEDDDEETEISTQENEDAIFEETHQKQIEEG
jgi:hypothetical protein